MKEAARRMISAGCLQLDYKSTISFAGTGTPEGLRPICGRRKALAHATRANGREVQDSPLFCRSEPGAGTQFAGEPHFLRGLVAANLLILGFSAAPAHYEDENGGCADLIDPEFRRFTAILRIVADGLVAKQRRI